MSRAAPRIAKLFGDGRLKWYRRMSGHHERQIDLCRHPKVIRAIGRDRYEIIDGNRRLISKGVREGLGFPCMAYVLDRQ
ncbi:Uncharacterised protein [uncultured archaeon]|nr:Uncharacterised protein [uncultured archaeon]